VNIGLRGKLFAVLAALVLVVGTATGLWLQSSLRSWLEQRIETQLLEEARASRELLAVASVLESVETVDPLADRLGAALEARVTVIGPDGMLLGDSLLMPEGVRAADNHADRPEVIAARLHGHGSSRRYSDTINTHMLYVAIPLEQGGVSGFARVALPLSEVEATLGQARALVLAAVLGALLLAMVVSALVSHLFASTLGRVLNNLRGQLPGDRSGSVGDELQSLLYSSEWISGELERRVRELASERDRFAGVLDSVEAGVLAVDPSGSISTLNVAARTLLALSEDAQGRDLNEVVVEPQLRTLLLGDSDGTAVELELAGPPLRVVLVRSARATSGALVVVLHDITELRRLEQIRRDFVANASHELRTPVTVLQANAETLLDGALDEPEAARRFVEAIHRHSQRLASLLGDLLDLSRIEAGRYAIDLEQVVVSELVSISLAEVADRAVKASVALSSECSENLSVLADRGAFRQVLINVLDNAVKYTPSGGKVVVRVKRLKGTVRIEVEDDGTGIGLHDRERVFERFYRVDPGRSRELGGTGLGLAIVKHLVVSMGGSVGIEAAVPHGTLVWIELQA